MVERRHNRRGLTLVETTVVVGTIVLMVGFGAPAVRSLMHSFQTESGTRSVVKAALSTAQAMAMARQRYVGVRFQKHLAPLSSSTRPIDLINAPQYMIFIMQDEPKNMGGLGSGYRAVEGQEPMKLPDMIGVMDLTGVNSNDTIDAFNELNGALTFSIIFSPSGKLVIQEVQVRNRDGFVDSASNAEVSTDDVFNKKDQVDKGVGLFYQDDYGSSSGASSLGLGKETSRTSFILFERDMLRAAYERKTTWSDYLAVRSTQALYVSPYTGDLISSK
jgi:hypothetical protein